MDLTPLGTACEWDQTVFGLLCLVSITEHHVLMIHPCCSRCQTLLLFKGYYSTVRIYHILFTHHPPMNTGLPLVPLLPVPSPNHFCDLSPQASVISRWKSGYAPTASTPGATASTLGPFCLSLGPSWGHWVCVWLCFCPICASPSSPGSQHRLWLLGSSMCGVDPHPSPCAVAS